MRGLRQQLARRFHLLGGEEFEEQRDEVRQIVGRDEEAGVFIQRLQIDHGLAAIAALAMDMLEQMQRQRAAAIEQETIALLQIVEIAGRKLVDQHIELLACGKRHQPFLVENGAEQRGRRNELFGGVCQERRQDLERLHHATSIGFLALRGEPNRLTSFSPPLQPLPNEKPQEPRIS
ncbi:hypothetical protein AFEL58S_00857 [Afipia felis]